MSVAVTVVVVERSIVGKQVQWHDRHDLRAVGNGSSFTEVRRGITKRLRDMGFTVLSAGFASNKTLRVLVSKQAPQTVNLRATSAGRMR